MELADLASLHSIERRKILIVSCIFIETKFM
jgi:hypothetical protein